MSSALEAQEALVSFVQHSSLTLDLTQLCLLVSRLHASAYREGKETAERIWSRAVLIPAEPVDHVISVPVLDPEDVPLGMIP